MTFAASNSLSSECVRAICALISSSMEVGYFPRRDSNLLRDVDGFSKSQYSLASKLTIGVRPSIYYRKRMSTGLLTFMLKPVGLRLPLV